MFSLLSISAFGQNCDKVLFTGSVHDTIRPQGFYNLMVVNRSTGQGVFGQPSGSFSVYANDGDTIGLSVRGYTTINTIVVADSNCQSQQLFFVEGKTQDIEAVTVYPLKTLEQIKEERASLVMRETRMVTGIEVMQSPITALYQAFSKKERTKRWIAEQEYKDDQVRILKELLRTYVAFEVIDLSDEEFESFISFLNVDEDFLKTASELDLITFIQDKYLHYRSMDK